MSGRLGAEPDSEGPLSVLVGGVFEISVEDRINDAEAGLAIPLRFVGLARRGHLPAITEIPAAARISPAAINAKRDFHLPGGGDGSLAAA